MSTPNDAGQTGNQTQSAPAQELTLAQAYDLAMQHLTAGRLGEAKHVYEQIIQADPKQPMAYHLLGMVAHQAGQNDIAVQLISTALSLQPDYVEAHNNLGIVHKNQGQFDDAAASFSKALKLEPNHVEALYNLANVFKDLNQFDDAVAHYRKALAIKPDYAQAHNNLGNALSGMGAFEDAVASYQKAVETKPDVAVFHNNLASALQQLKRYDEAEASYRQALTLNPEYAEARFNLSDLYRDQGLLEQAVASYGETLKMKPDYAQAHNNLGNTQRDLNKLQDAVTSYRSALVIDTNYAEAHNNLGNVLRDLGDTELAMASFRNVLKVDPNFADAHASLAIYDWIDADWKACHEHVDALMNIDHRMLVEHSQKYAVPFRTMLAALLELTKSAPDQYVRDPNMASLYAIGESHCLVPAHMAVNVGGKPHRVEPKMIVGCKAWHLANDADNKYKDQFKATVQSLEAGTKVVVMFGEIDCRPTEGILKAHKKTGGDLSQAIDDLVRGYVEFVVGACDAGGIVPIFYGVPARSLENHEATPEDEERLVGVIKTFNAALARETQTRQLPYLDVYAATNDADGRSSGASHIDATHLNPPVFARLAEGL